ncbi:MAG: hypothetical protein HKO10_03050 [Acidimicrobiia bacterium]|nr:hypothetical protein [Acidimicrobiia bacterium]
MKRLIWISLATVLFAACGSGEADDTTPSPTGGGAVGDIAITAIEFGSHVTLTNLGADPVSVDGLWLCNRPAYTELTGEIAPGASIEIEASKLGGLSADGAEVGLYSANSFGDPNNMLDYVGWGTGGGRAEVAANAGLWPAGEVVAVSGSGISAANGGASAADWS